MGDFHAPGLSFLVYVAAPVAGACGGAAATVLVYLMLARRHGWGQPIRADGPQAHLAKQGTPTMGGVAFVPWALAFAAAGLLGPGWERHACVAVLLAGLAMALIGLWDDTAKVIGGKPQGVKARWRLIAQFAVAAAVVVSLHSARSSAAGALTSLGWLGLWPLGMAGAVLQVFIIVGAVNAVNFTDGVDGLAAGTVAIAALGLACVGLLVAPEVGLAGAALAGACLGFLVYNRNPAKVFMGDVGSLGIGGMLAAAAVALRVELAFFLLGAIFWLEMASVVGQVASFKLTGKRILKMAPFHHHLELSGWSERKIVAVAYSTQVVLSAATVALVYAVGVH